MKTIKELVRGGSAVKMGVARTKKAKAKDPLADLLKAFGANLATAFANHPRPAPVKKVVFVDKMLTSLNKAAADLGILAKPDSPQHDVKVEPPARKHADSAYAAQKRRNTAFVVALARDQEAGKFGG